MASRTHLIPIELSPPVGIFDFYRRQIRGWHYFNFGVQTEWGGIDPLEWQNWAKIFQLQGMQESATLAQRVDLQTMLCIALGGLCVGLSEFQCVSAVEFCSSGPALPGLNRGCCELRRSHL